MKSKVKTKDKTIKLLEIYTTLFKYFESVIDLICQKVTSTSFTILKCIKKCSLTTFHY